MIRIEQKTHNVTSKIEKFLVDLKRTGSAEEMANYTDEYRERQIAEFKQNGSTPIVNAVAEYISVYEQGQAETSNKMSSEAAGFKAEDDSQETNFLLTKLLLADKFKMMDAEDIAALYNNGMGKVERAAFEEIGPLYIKSKIKPGDKGVVHPVLADIQRRVDANRAARVSDGIKKDLEFLDKSKSLYNFSKRFLGNLNVGKISGSDLFTWGGISATAKLDVKELRELGL